MKSESPRADRDDHCFVVPAYGDSPFLAGCLASLRAQTRKSRIVVATSTPSPFIEAAAREAGAELAINPQRQGIAADWNFSLRASPARYVTLAHQDDTYLPRFAERTLAALQATPDAALCFTAYQEIDDAGNPKRSKISLVKHALEALTLGATEHARGTRLLAFLAFGNPLPCSSVTFNLERLKGFSFAADYSSNLDWEAWIRLTRQGETFLHLSDRLIGRRHNALTATSKLIIEGRRQKEDRQMFRAIWPAPIADLIALVYRASY